MKIMLASFEINDYFTNDKQIFQYVYCLVDPRDKKIFYIGKGVGNRVFNHAAHALDENNESLKLDLR